MAEAVYVLCMLTSVACAVLLLKSYRATRTRLLLWSSLCFVGLAINNLLLFADLVLVPSMDLSVWRNLTAASALGLLVFGLVWDAR
jgi:hypothetical protein